MGINPEFDKTNTVTIDTETLRQGLLAEAKQAITNGDEDVARVRLKAASLVLRAGRLLEQAVALVTPAPAAKKKSNSKDRK